jgi:hypothetical protein
VITVTNEFTFYHNWEDDHDYLNEVKVIETNNEELGKILGKSIPQNAKAIENLIGDEYWDNDELMDFIQESGEVTQAIPDSFYEKGWAHQWEDFTIQVTLPDSLDENTDNEWDVEAPKEWNITELTVGSKITPDMVKQWYINWVDKHNKTFPGVITKIDTLDNDDEGPVDTVSIFFPDKSKMSLNTLLGRNKEGGKTSLETFNRDYLKPGYQVVKPLQESDDEWDVEAPDEWNIADLEVGGVVTPDMWNVSDPDVRFNFKRHTNYLDEPHTIEKIEKIKLKGKRYHLLRFDDGSSEYSFHLKK